MNVYKYIFSCFTIQQKYKYIIFNSTVKIYHSRYKMKRVFSYFHPLVLFLNHLEDQKKPYSIQFCYKVAKSMYTIASARITNKCIQTFSLYKKSNLVSLMYFSSNVYCKKMSLYIFQTFSQQCCLKLHDSVNQECNNISLVPKAYYALNKNRIVRIYHNSKSTNVNIFKESRN